MRAVGLLVLSACRGGRTPAPAPGAPAGPLSACMLQRGPRWPPDTLSVALSESIDPGHAPAAANDAERMVFRQLYETLVTVDCGGRVTAGLASEWRSTDGGRNWRFGLREHAEFWDGSPVRAADVLASWKPRDAGVGPLTMVGTVTGIGERWLTVTLAEPSAEVPLAFADPALGVSKTIRESRWPLGTGTYWIGEASDSTRVIIRPVAPKTGRSEVGYRVLGGGAALAAGVDVVITRDPAVLEDARARSEYVVVPLPWDRIYVLRLGVAHPRALPLEVRESLARAVSGEARPAEAPGWWRQAGTCRASAGPAGLAAAPRVVYPSGDAVAHTLAERTVALLEAGTLELAGGVPRGQRVRAVGLGDSAFAAAVRRGGDLASVVPVLREAFERCAALPVSPVLLLPLVETRAYGVLRPGRSGLAVEWDGTPRLLEMR